MPGVKFSLSEKERTALKAKAQSMGLTTSAYLRNVTRDSLRHHTGDKQAEVLGAIRALIPILAEALTRFEKSGPEHAKQLSKILLDRYDKER